MVFFCFLYASMYGVALKYICGVNKCLNTLLGASQVIGTSVYCLFLSVTSLIISFWLNTYNVLACLYWSVSIWISTFFCPAYQSVIIVTSGDTLTLKLFRFSFFTRTITPLTPCPSTCWRCMWCCACLSLSLSVGWPVRHVQACVLNCVWEIRRLTQ